MVKQNIHAGIISFKNIPLSHIKAAGQSLVKLPEFLCVWVRRVDEKYWGIEFLSKCNGACNDGGIRKEVGTWLKSIGVVRDSVLAINISIDVFLLKLMTLS